MRASDEVTRTPDGDHHLVLEFADSGLTTITPVTVDRDALAATGAEPPAAAAWAGAALMLLGMLAIAWPALTRRRTSPAR